MRGDDEGCFAVGKHVGEALVRIFQIEWQVSSPCFMNTEHADREIDTSLNHDTNEVLLTYTHVNKLVGYEVNAFKQGKEQTDMVKFYLFAMFTIIPAVTGSLGIIPMLFYDLNNEKKEEVENA